MDGKKKVLFYGAGINATQVYGHAVRESSGYGEPVAFIDGDVYKQGHNLFGLPIISWEEAQEQFDDNFYIYVTGNEKATPNIIGFLQEKNICAERIINFDLVEKRRGCWRIGTFYGICPIGENVIYGSCCAAIGNYMFRESFARKKINHTLATNIDAIYEGVNFFMAETEADAGELCATCGDLKEQYYYKKRKIRRVHFGGIGACNFKCSYCLYNHEEYYPPIEFQPYSVYGNILQKLKEDGLVEEGTAINIATGEVTISEMGRQFVKSVVGHPVSFFTNASIFDLQIAQAIEYSGNIFCSVDAGTPETFRKVKGVDRFELVCRNLKEYAKYGPVVLKYILIENVNDSQEDLEGFFRLADEVAVRVDFTRDYFTYGLFSDQSLKFAARFIKHFRKNGKLNMDIAAFIRSGEEERLNKMLEELEYDGKRTY